jgi:hydroxyethylthiazole kinase
MRLAPAAHLQIKIFRHNKKNSDLCENFSPVGAGATALRTDTSRRIMGELSPAVVRGNASEIMALALDERSTRGVDSAREVGEAALAAHGLTVRYGSVISVSGAEDLIVSARREARVSNGHPLMPKVTGLGCTATALTGAFAAVNPSAFDAAVNAMAVMGIAGEIAAQSARGPASFLQGFIDALYNLSESDVRARLKVRE